MRCRAFTLVELMIVTAILLLIAAPAYELISQGLTFQKHFDRRRALDAAARDAVDAWHRDFSLASAVAPGPDGGVALRCGDRRIQYLFHEDRLIRREPGRLDQVFAERVTRPVIEPVGGGLWRLGWSVRDSDGVRTWWRDYGALAAPTGAASENPQPEAAP